MFTLHGATENRASGSLPTPQSLLGYEYIAICDHAWEPERIARGLDETTIAKQQKEIEQANRELEGFMVLAGIECNIEPDGNLDIARKVLSGP